GRSPRPRSRRSAPPANPSARRGRGPLAPRWHVRGCRTPRPRCPPRRGRRPSRGQGGSWPASLVLPLQPMHSEQVLRDQVALATGRPQDGAPVLQLKGDASNRSYLRVGRWPDSHVVMVMPPGPHRSEEASKGGPPDELPFLNVHRYLEGLGVRVPRILRYDAAAAMMVLEDLGDLTFERALGGASREALYGRAVDLLAAMRAAAEARPDPRCVAYSRAFDEELYTWELHHFREYGLEAWSGKVPTAAERAELERAFASIAGRLAAAPRGFTHRDYQSRNLMMTGSDMVLIDFQDALQGPWQYDLV